MRLALDKLYTGAGIVAGACIVFITLMILSQIVGRWFGLIIPSTEDFSGYLLAAATFLALAHTFRGGGHIRVTLLIHLLSPSWQRMFTFATLIIFTVMVSWGTYYLCHLVWESWHFEELSQGYIAIPMWIPQLPVALGAIIFLISLVDDIASLVMRRTPSFLDLEE